MDNGLIIDAVFALVLMLGALFGAKRGLFRSLMGLVTVAAALIGAALLSDLLAEPAAEALMPRAEQSVQEWFGGESGGQGLQSAEADDLPDADAPADGAEEDTNAPLDATGILKRLLRLDSDGKLSDSLRQSAQDAALAAVHSLLLSVARALVFVLCFLLLTLLLRLLTRGLDKLFDLPVLHTLNSLGGGALGLIETALLLFLVCGLAPRLGITIFTDYESGTYLLSFFMNQTPRSAAAALLP